MEIHELDLPSIEYSVILPIPNPIYNPGRNSTQCGGSPNPATMVHRNNYTYS